MRNPRDISSPFCTKVLGSDKGNAGNERSWGTLRLPHQPDLGSGPRIADLGFTEVAVGVLRSTADRLGVACTVYLIDDGGEARLVAAAGCGHGGTLSAAAVSRVVSSWRAVAFPPRTGALSLGRRGLSEVQERGIAALLAVPLRVADEGVGVVTVATFAPRAPHDVDLLAPAVALADDLARALEAGRPNVLEIEDAGTERTRPTYVALERQTALSLLGQLPQGVIAYEVPGWRLLKGDSTLGLLWGAHRLWHGSPPSFYRAGSLLPDSEHPMVRAAVEGDLVVGEEFEFQRVDGSSRLVKLDCSPIRSVSGRILAIVAAVEDRTEVQDARLAARGLQDDLQAIRARQEWIDCSTSVGVFIAREDGTIVDANRGFLDLFGYSPDTVRAEAISVGLMTPGEYVTLDDAALEEARGSGASTTYLKEMLHRDGHRIPVTVNIGPLKGFPGRYVASVLDTTELFSARAELWHLEADVEAEVARRSSDIRARLDELEGLREAVGHDLRVPVHAVRLLLDQAKSSLSSGLVGNVSLALEKAARSAQRLAEIINGILPSGIEGIAGEGDQADVGVAMSAATELLESEVRAVNASLVLPERWPRVACRPTDAYEIVVNLLSNALRHAGPAPHIRVSWARREDTTVLRVEDNGPGVAPEHRQAVFSVFHKASSSPGSGLGLAIVKRICERYGGSITVEDSDLGGAAFVVTLPVGGG